jgi:phage repressor protein C with HTH and peptisase S24 domain
MLSGQPITNVIPSPPMDSGKLIETERLRRGWSQAELGKRVGISQPAIRKIEVGTTSKSKHLPKIAEELGIPLAKLDPALSQHNGSGTINQTRHNPVTRTNPELHTFPGERLMGATDLPVHSIVQGGRGALVLSSEPFTQIGRPHNLLGIKDAYGVLVSGGSMALEFREGDIAYVNPHLPPREGDPCVFQSHKDDGAVEAVIKYLARSGDASDALWYVEQSNPAKKFTLKKSEWQICHVVVGKTSAR